MVTLLVFGIILLVSSILLITVPTLLNRRILNEKVLYSHRHMLAVICFIVGVALIAYYYFTFMA